MLPEEILPDQIVGRTFDYDNLWDLLDDVVRLRRKTGWKVASLDSDLFCNFLVGEGVAIVYFRFPLSQMRLVDWPRTYLGVDKIRYAFSRKTERQVLVKAFNDIHQDIEHGEAKSAWQRLLDDDIL